MAKFEAANAAIFSIFTTPEWAAEGIAVFPSNFTNDKSMNSI